MDPLIHACTFRRRCKEGQNAPQDCYSSRAPDQHCQPQGNMHKLIVIHEEHMMNVHLLWVEALLIMQQDMVSSANVTGISSYAQACAPCIMSQSKAVA